MIQSYERAVAESFGITTDEDIVEFNAVLRKGYATKFEPSARYLKAQAEELQIETTLSALRATLALAAQHMKALSDSPVKSAVLEAFSEVDKTLGAGRGTQNALNAAVSEFSSTLIRARNGEAYTAGLLAQSLVSTI